MIRRPAALAALLALACPACDEAPPPTAPTIIVRGGDQTVIIGSNPPGSGASPAPGQTGCNREAIDSVRVNPFGYEGGTGTKPANSSGLLPSTWTALVTATPKDPSGRDVPAELHGSQITWAVATGAHLIEVTDDPTQPFNKHVKAKSGVTSGEFLLTATVCGVTGGWNGRITP